MGVASTPMDYEAVSGTFRLEDGVHEANFTVRIFNDSFIENPDEAIGLRLFGARQWTTAGVDGGHAGAGNEDAAEG